MCSRACGTRLRGGRCLNTSAKDQQPGVLTHREWERSEVDGLRPKRYGKSQSAAPRPSSVPATVAALGCSEIMAALDVPTGRQSRVHTTAAVGAVSHCCHLEKGYRQQCCEDEEQVG